jgi:hypothetical protein
MAYVLYAGFAGRSDRRAGIAAGVVAAESLIFAGNGFRCPLTQVAERLGAERGSVTDIYLPRWLARNLPAIQGHPLPLLGVLDRAETCLQLLGPDRVDPGPTPAACPPVPAHRSLPTAVTSGLRHARVAS